MSTAARWHRHRSHTALPPLTITLTDVVYSTTPHAAPTALPPAPTAAPAPHASTDPWAHHLHQLLPLFAVFAVIGMLTVLVLLAYLAYRFYRSGHAHPSRHDDREPIHFENSASELKRLYAPPYTDRHRLDSPIENGEKPISATFVPITTSPLTLVPRMEVWQDPQRRQGVDEIDLWERKQQRQESSRSSSETISHVAMARTALEKSRMEHSSSQWLSPSGSRSL